MKRTFIRNILVGIGISTSIAIGMWYSFQKFGVNEAQGNEDQLSKENLQIEADKGNKTLPRMFGEDSLLRRILAEDHALIWEIVLVNLEFSDLDKPIWIKQNRIWMRKTVCRDPKIQNAMRHDLRMIYMYYDKNGRFFTKYTLDRKECGF